MKRRGGAIAEREMIRRRIASDHPASRAESPLARHVGRSGGSWSYLSGVAVKQKRTRWGRRLGPAQGRYFAGGATETPFAPVRSTARPTSPDVLASSTTARR